MYKNTVPIAAMVSYRSTTTNATETMADIQTATDGD